MSSIGYMFVLIFQKASQFFFTRTSGFIYFDRFFSENGFQVVLWRFGIKLNATKTAWEIKLRFKKGWITWG